MESPCSRAAGLHLSGSEARLVIVDLADGIPRLLSASTHPLPDPTGSNGIDGLRLDEIAELLSRWGPADSDNEKPSLAVVLCDEWFQLRRVPLEIASGEARKDQIRWEASQALMPSEEDYWIECRPSDRSGIWMAVRTTIVDAFEEMACEQGLPVARPIPLPLAFFYACDLARGRLEPGTERLAGAHIRKDRAWLISLAVPGDAREELRLRSIEAVPASRQEPLGDDPVDGAVRWLCGDRTHADRQLPGERIVICGEPNAFHRLSQRLPLDPPPVHLDPFELLDTDQELPDAPTAFAPAAGAAWSLLKGDAS